MLKNNLFLVILRPENEAFSLRKRLNKERDSTICTTVH